VRGDFSGLAEHMLRLVAFGGAGCGLWRIGMSGEGGYGVLAYCVYARTVGR
jgi:hypothetical protein